MRQLQIFVLLAAMICHALPSHGREKNPTEGKKNEVSGNISAGGSLSSGNINKLDFKATGGLAIEDSIASLVLSAKYNYSKVEENTKNNGVETHFKVDFLPYRRWSPLIAHEYIHNRYKGYNFRMSAVAGAKCNIYRQPQICDYSISLAGVYDVVDYTAKEKKLDDQAFRISLRPKMIQKIGNSVNFIEKIFYQPRATKFKDYLIKNETEIECKVISILFLSITYEYDYRSVLPPMKEGTSYEHHDHTLEFAVKVKL